MHENKIVSVNELWQFFNLSSSLFFIIGTDGYFKHINPAVTSLLGYSESELLSRPCFDFIHEDDIASTIKKIDDVNNGRHIQHFSNRYKTASGDYKWLNWTVSLPTAEGLVYAVAQDWTEKNKLEEQLIQERLQKEKSVMEATIYGQEAERMEIGKELHDNVCQMLASAKLLSETALHNHDMREELLPKEINILNQAIDEVRNLSRSLVGPDAQRIVLVDSINDLLDTLGCNKKIQFHFTYKKNCEKLPGNVKLMIFRIIQEQVNNVLKHAYARNVWITINVTKRYVSTCVKDDGIGFDLQSRRKGIGLTNIAARTASFNGKVKIETALNKGCKILAIIPRLDSLKSAGHAA